MADHEDLYDDLYAEHGDGDELLSISKAPGNEEYEEPLATASKPATDHAASSGKNFIPKKPTLTQSSSTTAQSTAGAASSSSTSFASRSSFIPSVPSSAGAPAAKSAFIPSASSTPSSLSAPPSAQQQQHQGQQLQQQQQQQQQRAPDHALPRPIPVATTPGSLTGPNTSEDGKMFVGGLSWDTTDDGLKQYFSQFGKVVDCNIMKDLNTGTSRGFGFLRFEDPKAVNMVMVREHFLDGKIIDPKRAIPRDTSLKSSKIFVGGIPSHTTNESFRATFLQFGKILDHNLMMDKETGRPRGFGFITFETEEAGRTALGMDGQVVLDGKTVDVKRATSKNAPGNQQQGQQAQSLSQQNQQISQQQNFGNAGMIGMGGMPSMDIMSLFNPMMGLMAPGGVQGSQMDPTAMASMFQQHGWGTGSWNPAMMQQMLMAANQHQQQQGGGVWNPMMMGMGGMNPMMGMAGVGMGGIGSMGGMGGSNDGNWSGQQQQQRGFSAQQRGCNAGSGNYSGMRQSSAGRTGGSMKASTGAGSATPSGAVGGSNSLPNRPSPSTVATSRGTDHRSGSASNIFDDIYRREKSPERRSGGEGGGKRYEERPLR